MFIKEKMIRNFIYCLLLILSLSSVVSCESGSSSEKIITDKGEMVEVFTNVNDAISRFKNLKKGTIIYEYTGLSMPANVVKNTVSFEKSKEGIKYYLTQNYTEGEPFVANGFEESGALPDSAYIDYPKKEIDDDLFNDAVKVTVSQNKKGTEYRIDWSLTHDYLPENYTLRENYSAYTVDSKGYLVEVYDYVSGYENQPDSDDPNEVVGSRTINLTNYE